MTPSCFLHSGGHTRTARFDNPGARVNCATIWSLHAIISEWPSSCRVKCSLRAASEVNSYKITCLAHPVTDDNLRVRTEPGMRDTAGMRQRAYQVIISSSYSGVQLNCPICMHGASCMPAG